MESDSKYIVPSVRIFAILLGILGLALLYRSTARTFHVIVDGQELEIQSHSRTVEAVLRQGGILISENDLVFPGLEEFLDDGAAIEVQKGRTIILSSAGEVFEIQSVGRSIGDIVAEADLTLLPGDRVWADGIPKRDVAQNLDNPPALLSVEQSEAILLDIDGEQILIRSAAPTLAEALAEAGVVLRTGDDLVPGAETPLRGLEQASLHRSNPITILVDDEVIHSRSVANSVSAALTQAGISLIGLDYSIPEMVANIPEDGEIEVVRVREEVLIEQTPIPFETLYQPNPELEIDQQSIMEPGSYGVQASRIRVTLENGEEISRLGEGQWVAREPQGRTIGYGTNIVVRTMDTPNGPISYWRTIRMYATSYSPSRAGVPDDWPWFGITACGKELVKGLVAIDNRYIPFHTMMYVPGYGFAEACDIGGGVKGRWIDLGYEDHNWENWHQYITVYFLTPVPPASTIAWVFP
ncbi:MAG: DUF348 domain-containing protein [Anaerolineales bacterium]|nr:DUF348 domain-containing protein [Anaerolineales bacterium]